MGLRLGLGFKVRVRVRLRVRVSRILNGNKIVPESSQKQDCVRVHASTDSNASEIECLNVSVVCE